MKAKDYLSQIAKLDRQIRHLMREKEYWRQMAFSITKDTTQLKYNPNRATSAGYERCIEKLSAFVPVETGRFGADMKVSIENDGPFTILLDSKKGF